MSRPSPTIPEIITGIGNTLLGLDKTVKEALLGLNYLNGVQARIDGILFESASNASNDNPIFMIIEDCLNSLL